MIAKILTLGGMLATVAWFFWNPNGWIFQWEPIVVFLLSFSGYIAAEKSTHPTLSELRGNPTHQHDIFLYNEFLIVLPSRTIIDFLKRQDFLSDFKLKRISPLRDFISEWDNAEHEFQSLSLEELRKKLMEAGVDLSMKISKYSSPNRSGFQAVRADDLKHIKIHEDRFRQEANLINDAAELFIEIHQQLVREGQKICSV